MVLTYGSPAAPGPHVEGTRRPHERDSVGGVVGVERRVLEEGLDELRQLELLVIVRQRLRPLKVQRPSPKPIPVCTETIEICIDLGLATSKHYH